MKEFFGPSKYTDGEYHYIRGEGDWGWEHLLLMSWLIIAIIAPAAFIGRLQGQALEKTSPYIIFRGLRARKRKACQ